MLVLAVVPNRALGAVAGATASSPSSASAISAFTVKDASPLPGETASFEIGVTPNDGTSWLAGSTTVEVDLSSGGTAIEDSPAVAIGVSVDSGVTLPLFVPLAIATTAAGSFEARATVRHDGKVVSVSAPVEIVVGAKRAAVVPATAKKNPLLATLGTNDLVARRGAQAITLSATGHGPGGSSLVTTGSLTTTPGGSQPLVTFGTKSTTVRVGSYAPSFDNLVLSGPNGTGFSVQQLFAGTRTLQFAMLSGGHATLNPFTVEGLTFGTPLRGGTAGVTYAYAQTDGPAPAGGGAFLRSGNLLGFDFTVPANRKGLSYELRYGLIDFVDGSDARRHTDRSFEALAGFTLLQAMWTFDAIRSGPYYPTLSAPGITADREDEVLTAARSFGPLSASLRLEGTRTGLNSSPSGENSHVYNEGASLGYAFRNGDSTQLDLSNAINHVLSYTNVEGLTQNAAFSYRGQRGVTNFEFDSGTATDQQNSGTTSHTVTDAVSVGRTVMNGIGLSSRYAFTNVLGDTPSATSVSAQETLNVTYARPVLTFFAGYNRSHTLPFAGTSRPATLGVNAGLTFKPAKTFSLQTTFTGNRGPFATSNLRINATGKI